MGLCDCSSAVILVQNPFEIDPNMPVYTIQEVKEHNTPTSAWMAIQGKVYDVTSFLTEHPGGEAILEGIGMDATEMYIDVGHTQHANSVLQKYYIGNLQKAEPESPSVVKTIFKTAAIILIQASIPLGVFLLTRS